MYQKLYVLSKELLEKVDFMIDAGRAGSGKPSRVIDLASGEVIR